MLKILNRDLISLCLARRELASLLTRYAGGTLRENSRRAAALLPDLSRWSKKLLRFSLNDFSDLVLKPIAKEAGFLAAMSVSNIECVSSDLKQSHSRALPWPPSMIRIHAAGESQHSAVALPAYGLMFDATPPALASDWHHAQQIARECRVLGYDDWRLPESHELALLIRHDCGDPAIDTEFFPHTPTNDWFFSNTTMKRGGASGSFCVWAVDFYRGLVGIAHQIQAGYVRAMSPEAGFVRAVRRVALTDLCE